MKKLLILTLTFIICTSSFIGCTNTTHPIETSKQTSEEADTNKQEVKEIPKQPKKETNNEASPKDNSNNNLELFGISTIENNSGFNYTLKSLGNYSKDKLYIDSKNNFHGFIIKDTLITSPNIDNFKYNEILTLYGHIKYPDFLNLNNEYLPVSFAGFQFIDSTGQIKFEFNCDESHIDPETNENYSADYIYKVMIDKSLDSESKITYKAKGKYWDCISSEKYNIITYYFVKLRKDLNTSFSYTYPKKYEKQFDPIIQESYNSFKIDNIIKKQ